ncbi:MAG: DUF1385 domain-containing protein, partial [Lachnospiraceae bacterium]|nr:DUF1385 domain-containing protein [Lachnospiraceae bacterium]
FMAILEGVIRIVIFLLYMWLIGMLGDIKRLYGYHGAEHKCINCLERGRELNLGNVKRSSRFHKRCGTSFVFVVLLISIVLFMFIRVDMVALKVLLRILLMPVVAGISYEFIRLAGRSDNFFIDILSKPGLWLQRITTREPDDEMIEVGIASVEAVFDWKKFLKDEFDLTVEEDEDGVASEDYVEEDEDGATSEEYTEDETKEDSSKQSKEK